ncbi:hypothetical protein EVAR_52793_1 [Eumeta japonica]|uniref:Uncharacterized protein n=1 Tax=Eumeta variegata TaxID=151549 RepID=A0A4C1Z5B1_EUMVA|nr:hypothetical protein EVAR_52793_1 [Eumeta japonica]
MEYTDMVVMLWSARLQHENVPARLVRTTLSQNTEKLCLTQETGDALVTPLELHLISYSPVVLLVGPSKMLKKKKIEFVLANIYLRRHRITYDENKRPERNRPRLSLDWEDFFIKAPPVYACSLRPGFRFCAADAFFLHFLVLIFIAFRYLRSDIVAIG